MSEEDGDLLGLMRLYNAKVSSHIGVIISVTFGSFAILNFLRGTGWPPKTFSAGFLLIIEVLLSLLTFYSLTRVLHYSSMVETLRTRNERIADLSQRAFDEALEQLPLPARWVFQMRRIYIGRMMYSLIAIVAIALWLVTVFTVLTLPSF